MHIELDRRGAMSKYGVNTKLGNFCPQIQRTLFDKFSNPPFLFSEKITGCVIEPQSLANVGTFCVDAVLGHSVSTINLNGGHIHKLCLLPLTW